MEQKLLGQREGFFQTFSTSLEAFSSYNLIDDFYNQHVMNWNFKAVVLPIYISLLLPAMRIVVNYFKTYIPE